MRAQNGAADRERAGRERGRAGAARVPGRVPPQGPTATLLALQRAAGNAAVARAVEEERHRHGAGCGHDAPVQRSAVHQVLSTSGQPLDTALRTEMESRFDGEDFSGVRVHTDTVAQRSAAEIGARAYTSGSHVVWDGRDKHTLAHELDHVRQQRRGAVPGTDDGSGLRVSDPSDWAEKEAEATARRVMDGPASVQRATDGPSRAEAPSASAEPTVQCGPTVQRKGHETLESVANAPAKTLAGRLAGWIKVKPASEAVAPVKEAVLAYDRSTVRDPMRCLTQLADLQMLAMPLREGALPGDLNYLEQVLEAVRAEMDVVGGQVARDGKMPESAAAPYKAMTDRGTMWKDPQFAQSTVNFGMSGSSYVREMSEMNRAELTKEIGGAGGKAWVKDVRAKLENELGNSVLAHYTQQERADAMLASEKKLKPKSELGDAENNTMNVDELVLGNDGFVFFYIEPRGKTDRAPRFGEIRLELGIDRLVSEGWIMLSDFIQRDYPKLVAPANRPDLPEHKAKSGQRELAAKQAGHRPVREFKRGQVEGDALTDMVTAFSHLQDPEEQQAHMFARQLALTVPGDEMVYGPEKELKRPELLHKNILAGSDIIPGLVERAIVEIIRFEQANPPLAQRLKAMSGAQLMDFLLRDLLRPQAMLPNSVDISAATVTKVKGKG
ncbi:eCIS core domain-containing protein [Streptomyces sp. SP17KL33]|uniref:eCIS core domain-containing protein n=1 Tax=Streptomyces sp. SP17KL33 TaxID=3002534 RepID=UPI003FCCFD7F